MVIKDTSVIQLCLTTYLFLVPCILIQYYMTVYGQLDVLAAITAIQRRI